MPLVRFLCASLLAACLSFSPTLALALAQHVLILNSYHKGYDWTDEQSETILERLEKAVPTATKDVVYMDWKRHPTPETLSDMEVTLRHRYAGRKVDVVVTTDDAALLFALKHRAALFGNAPVIYSGIYPSTARALTAGQTEVTGVYEQMRPEETLAFARRLNPGYRRFFLVHDSSETSLAFEDVVREAVTRISPPLDMHVLRDSPFGEIRQRLTSLPKDSFVLLTSYARDSTGLVMAPEQFAAHFSAAASVPIFTFYNHLIGSGVIGGVVLDGRLQGEAAAQLAISILQGAPASSLPPIDRDTLRPTLDYAQALRFGLPTENLGPNALVVGKPFSFIETYWRLVLLVGAAFAVLLTLVGLLLINVEQRKRAQTDLQANYSKLEESRADLQRSEERYRLAAQASRDIIWDWNIAQNRCSFSGRVYEILGYGANECADIEIWFSLVHPDDVSAARAALDDHLAGRTLEYRHEYRIRRSDDRYIWLQANGRALFDALGKPYHMVGSYTDITAAKEHQERISFLAFHDALTGLPNREQLRAIVDRSIARMAREGGELTLIFIDMDNFKYINDSSGHKVGDQLLIEAAERLRLIAGNEVVVSRLGGDEFVLVAENFSSQAIVGFQKRLRKSFQPPFDIQGNRFYVTCSAGIATFPKDGRNFDELLQNADSAMYQAKRLGKGELSRFSPEMKQIAVARIQMHNRLRVAQELDAFSLNFQPQVDARNGALRGAEALLRWNDPELGAIPPDRFIPACEETGLISLVGRWTLIQACRELHSLEDRLPADFVVSVNVSVVQLMRHGFEREVLDILQAENVKPSQIELEITESQLMGVFEEGSRRLRTLMNAGINIALDDFGTGYSSLTYLRRLPLNTLKLDKEFIRNLHQDKDDQYLIGSIIRIAHDIGLTVVAEGVELPEQRKILSETGCDWLQGYLIGRPMDSRNIETFIDGWRGFA